MMKLILKREVENLGDAGDVVDVKPGYARNYLIPHGFAYEASPANVRRLEEERQRSETRGKKGYLEARRRASQLEGLSLTFHALAGVEGKLFGSVTSADVSDRANESGLDFELDRRQIVLTEPLKQLGVFSVPVRLHADVEVEIEVQIERGE